MGTVFSLKQFMDCLNYESISFSHSNNLFLRGDNISSEAMGEQLETEKLLSKEKQSLQRKLV